MAKRNENRPNVRRPEKNAAAAPPAPSPARRSPLWMVAVALVGGVAIAGAVVLETTREEPVAETPRMPAPMPTPMITPNMTPVGQPGGAAQTFVPQPPGEAPPGKVWSPTCGHWHDLPAGTPPAR
jgi:hypothetical protein